ncbi:MAG TPA: AI-2E family transporter [Candidatus Acidoferrales bacterium]|nr:AI-2E family transporter [Candidatus Acidoferrales bacterium]
MVQNAEDRFSNVLFYGVVLCLAYLVFRIFEPFLVPLGWGAVFGVIFYSLNKRFERKWGRTQSAALITLGVTLVLIVPVLLLAAMFVREGIAAAVSIQTAMQGGGYGWISHAWGWLAAHIAAQGITVDLPGLVRQGAGRGGEYLATELGRVIRNIVVFLFELFVMLFALFYFLRDGDSILDRFRLFLPFEEKMTDRMLTEARELIFASVTTSLVIAGVQGVICGAAFAIVGLGSPIFWGVVMGFLSLLPVVGAWPVWIPGALWLFSTGHAVRALILIAICGALGATIDNILRPMLLGGRASLNGLLVFISVLGGIAVFGVLGVVLGPIVVATTVGMLDVYSGKDATNSAPDVPVR